MQKSKAQVLYIKCTGMSLAQFKICLFVIVIKRARQVVGSTRGLFPTNILLTDRQVGLYFLQMEGNIKLEDNLNISKVKKTYINCNNRV